MADESYEQEYQRDPMKLDLLKNILYQSRLQKMWLRRIAGALWSLVILLFILTLLVIRAEWLDEQDWAQDVPTAQQIGA